MVLVKNTAPNLLGTFTKDPGKLLGSFFLRNDKIKAKLQQFQEL
jgi:hypothetical protein